MIKNKIFYLITFIYAISLWSCSSEQMDDVETPVTFTICLDNNKTHSRAISDGTSVNQLIYAVYTTDGTLVIPQVIVDNAGAISTKEGLELSISVLNGFEYKLVCWAQNSASKAYAVSDDMKVSVKYDGYYNNDESRDAFFGVSEPFTVNDKNIRVELKRPFAQLNAAAHPFEWKHVKDYHNFEITQSSATISGIPNVLNLLDGSVKGETDVYFKPAAIPTDPLFVDVDENGKDEEYVHVSMSYVLVSDSEQGTTHKVDFHFYDKEGNAVKFSKFHEQMLEEVNLQRNMQTNIVGQVLSTKGDLVFATPAE